jgi:NAD(P)-dependent dehydrogenase (short-subunit alcohol dehydrogenase family)
MKQDSVKAFAEAINKRAGSLDILVNNAGLGYTKKSFTEQGVGMLTQVCAAAGCCYLCYVVMLQMLLDVMLDDGWVALRQSRAKQQRVIARAPTVSGRADSHGLLAAHC